MHAHTRRALHISWSLLLLMVASVVPARPTLAQELGTPPAGALSTARAFWSSLDSLWKARDAQAFRELFTENASFAFVDRGVTLEPRTMIDRHFADQFARQSPALRHLSSVRSARVIAPDVIAADVGIEVWRTAEDGGAPTLVRRFETFAVMRRIADRWRIELLRAYLLPAAPAPR
jgi:uncharacterized protein (TIGR02246 family)